MGAIIPRGPWLGLQACSLSVSLPPRPRAPPGMLSAPRAQAQQSSAGDAQDPQDEATKCELGA